jgi:mucin-19
MKNGLIISLALVASLAFVHDARCQTVGPRTSDQHLLRGYRASPAAFASPLGRLPETKSLRLVISVALRNRESLASLLKDLYDPANPDYRHYLTPGQFTERFGPTADDYQTVINFAKANRLAIASTHDSRTLLDVQGQVSDIERAFHVALWTYQHPTEDRQFFAPNAEPWLDPALPIQDVAGLSDYALLHSASHKIPAGVQTGSAGGSGANGDYMGQDFRNAYAPGVTLQGSGQIVGLFEAAGYYTSDIANYEQVAGLAPVPLENVLIDNFSGTPGSGNGEVAVDIETTISMSPGLAAVVVFESSNNVADWLDILDRMASSNQIKQFSCSWGYTGGSDPNTSFDSFFQQMAAQGQSFFQASGDGDAWATPIWVPADSPYVTSVGGTTLTMTGFGAAYASETVWNSGNLGASNAWFAGGNGYLGSGGGVSTVYSIPSWQRNVSMTANLGSTNMRNMPDVALTALNVWVAFDNGQSGSYFGTSCSPPLWAGFTALVNELAANSNKPPVGFLNPAIYALGQGPNYNLCFHDITTGSNTSSSSPTRFFAAQGYDLCTGWGTPAGSNLINALAGIYQPTITSQPANQSVPFGSKASFSVTATGAAALSYQWKFDGAIIGGATLTNLNLTSLTPAAAGSYTVIVTNQWGSLTSSVGVLNVGQATPIVTWANPAPVIYGAALASSQLNATASVPGNFAYTPASGMILNAGTRTLSVVFTPTDTVDYRNVTNTVSLVVSPASLTVTANNRTKSYSQTVTFAGTEFVTSGLVNGNTVTSVTLASSGASATATVGGSPYTIVPSVAVGTGLANYTISYASGGLTVSPAALTVTANNRSKTYGQTVTFAGTEFTSSGLVNNDTVTSTTLTSSGAAATAIVAGAPYAIVSSAAVGTGLNNYTISYISGMLSVNPATLTVTAKNRSKTYGQSVTFAGTEFSTSGLLNSDAVTGVTLSSFGVAATATVAGSPYTIVASAAVGTGLNNYTITYIGGTLTVGLTTLTVTADNRTKTYGQSVTFAGTELVAGGLLSSDTVTSVTLTSSGAAADATVADSPYAIVPSAAVGTGLANYTVTYVNGALTVAAATLAITWDDPAPIIYGAPLTSKQLDATANVPGNFIYNPTNGSVLNAGNCTLSAICTPEDMVDYGSAINTVGLVVSNAPLTVTAANANRTFGQINPVLSGRITGLTNGDNITATYSTTASTSSPLGAYAIVPILVDPNKRQTNYTISLTSGTLTVSEATPTLTWPNPTPIIYGTALDSNQLDAAANVPGRFAYEPTNGTVLNTGTNALSVVFTPIETMDYSDVNDMIGLVVSPASLIVTASSFSRPFGVANPVFAGAISGLTNGDDISATYSCGATTSSPVGTYLIVPSLVDPNDRQTNYAANLVNGILTVGHPPETFAWTNPAPMTYGAGLTSIQLNAIANIPGTYVYDPTNGTALDSGTNILSVIFAPADTVNYISVTDSVSVVVLPVALTVTADDTNRAYGEANPVFMGIITGVTNGDTITVPYTCGTTVTSPVGTYPVVPGAAVGTELTNYTITYVSGVLTVTPAALMITANNSSKFYGQTATFGGMEFMSGGLLNNDTVTGVSLTSSGAAATATLSGSPYAIVPSSVVGIGLTNYTISYANGALTVDPAHLSIMANNRSKTYGQSVTFAGTEFTAAGLVNGDTVTSVALTSPGTAASATVAGSSYAIIPDAAVGTGLNNYTVFYISGTLSVNPAILTVTANSQVKTYGQTMTFMGTEFAAGGLVNGDSLTSVTLSSSGASPTATVPGSPYNVVPSAAVGAGLNNYTIVYANGSLTVNPGNLTVTANNQIKTYGQFVTFAGTEITSKGLLNSDTVNGATLTSSGTAATATVLGSPYAIVPTSALGKGLNNYTIFYASGALTVNLAVLTVTANNQTKTYGQIAAFAGTEFISSGLLNSDTVASTTLNSSGAATTAMVVGSPYTIVPSAAVGTGLNNYTISYASGTLTVNPATLIITANNRTKTYGQTVTFAGTEFATAGLLNGDTVTSVTLTGAGAPATATAAGSPYAIVPSAAVGTGLVNYTITYIAGALIVTAWQPVIQSAQQSGNFVTFSWSAAPTQMYQIQSTTNLDQGAWTDLGDPIAATNSIVTASDSITNLQMFYRVVLAP